MGFKVKEVNRLPLEQRVARISALLDELVARHPEVDRVAVGNVPNQLWPELRTASFRVF